MHGKTAYRNDGAQTSSRESALGDSGTELLLAIDAGTQSVRALLFDLEGKLVARTQQPLKDYVAPQPGWLEHDVEAFWNATSQVCRKLWLEHPELRDRVRGVAVTTQRGSVMPVDREGQPLHPAIIWLDQRKAEHLPRLAPWWRAALGVVGVSDLLRAFQRDAEANWFAEAQPDVWARTHKFVLLSGYLNWKLTGRWADSTASQVGYLPFDFRRHAWARSWDWKWQALPLDREQLPELVEVGGTLGTVTREAAEICGIPAGLPVIAAAADKACEILGAGALTPEVGALSYGTTATINITSARYLEATRWVPPYPAALPGRYSVEFQIFRGYWMVDWFKQNFAAEERMAAEQAGVLPESLFDELVGQVPAGSHGLMLQPYWSPGIRHPGPDAKGAVIGFGDVHTRAHLYRAILEGLAYALREGSEKIEAASGRRIQSLRVSGGGSQSDAALQLTADVFGLPTARPHTYETSGLGAAIVASVGLGLHRDFDAAVAAMTRTARVFDPVPHNAEIYDALYGRVYKHMYQRLAPLYAEIQQITGYPTLV
jgi:sugar (pentulose or hexulose) kinase